MASAGPAVPCTFVECNRPCSSPTARAYAEPAAALFGRYGVKVAVPDTSRKELGPVVPSVTV